MTTTGAQTVRLEAKPLPGEMAELQRLVAACMQCGTCTGSCPAASQMDLTPRQVMMALQVGLEDDAIGCQAIWDCAACYMCTARCPRDIPISDVMCRLRTLALDRGLAGPRETAFVDGFLGNIQRYGRQYEPELMVRYSLRNNPFGLLKMIPFALRMIQKGKIEFLPHRINGRDQLQRIFGRLIAKRPTRESTEVGG
jgi:heterodisulfide reductase subunit C